jgi:hypothetical protein
MDFRDIERILELVKEHDLAEFELERDGLKVRVRKAGAPTFHAAPMPIAVAPAAPPALPPAAAAASAPLAPSRSGLGTRHASDSLEFPAKGPGNAGRGLANVDLPLLIERVLQIDAHARELEVLFLLHARQPEPAAGHQEPARPIDVEALLAVPALRARCEAMQFRTELAHVRKNEGRDLDPPPGQRKNLLLETL